MNSSLLSRIFSERPVNLIVKSHYIFLKPTAVNQISFNCTALITENYWITRFSFDKSLARLFWKFCLNVIFATRSTDNITLKTPSEGWRNSSKASSIHCTLFVLFERFYGRFIWPWATCEIFTWCIYEINFDVTYIWNNSYLNYGCRWK